MRITSWRMSNHRLAIEKGRYAKPIIPRDQRLCKIRLELEDEDHVIYRCPLYIDIRAKYKNLVSTKHSVKLILNPSKIEEIYQTARFLQEIEILHDKTFP